MGAIKAFLVGSAKLALALVIVVVVIALGVWGYSSRETRNQNLKEAPLASKKAWPTQYLLSSMPVDVATAWRGGQTYYQVKISDYSDEKYSRTADASITLQFHDNDGFKLWEKTIPWGEMTGLTGKDGTRVEGYSWTGDEFTSSDDYGRGGRVDVAWRGIASKKPAVQKDDFVADPSPPKPPDVLDDTDSRVLANWRKLKVGQTEDTVRGIIGDPTNVVTYGLRREWQYGRNREGGSVTFRDGAVTGWRQPGT
jgi:hypothetical protein